MKLPRAAALLAALLIGAASGALAQTKPATKPATTPATTPARPPAAAPKSSAETLDGIAAVVNDDVILVSDVEEQLFLFLQQANARPDSSEIDTLRRQVLDQLINEKLVVAEAKKQGITVTDAELNRDVDAALDDARRRFPNEAAFQEQLRKENMTEDRLKEKYRADLRRRGMMQKLVQKQIPHKPVTAAEAEAYFKANTAKFPKVPAECRLSVIQIPVEADSATTAAARAKAVAARKRILAGEKFAKVAAEVSDDPNSARSGGDLGFFTRGTMEPALEAAAFGIKIGQLSDVVRTPYGWHVLETLERDTVKTIAGRDSVDRDGRPVLEAHVRHILIKVPIGDDDVQRASDVANKVYQEAMKGEDFPLLVKRYSHYEGPATAEGDLGFVSLGSLQPAIRAGVEPLGIGEVSKPLPNNVGFNIFKVTDRKDERAYTLDEVKDELPSVVSEMKFRDRYDEWVKSLRAKASVQIH